MDRRRSGAWSSRRRFEAADDIELKTWALQDLYRHTSFEVLVRTVASRGRGQVRGAPLIVGLVIVISPPTPNEPAPAEV